MLGSRAMWAKRALLAGTQWLGVNGSDFPEWVPHKSVESPRNRQGTHQFEPLFQKTMADTPMHTAAARGMELRGDPVQWT